MKDYPKDDGPEEGFHMTEDDLPPVWVENVSHLSANFALGLLILDFILVACSPAIVWAVWKALL